MEYKIQKLYDQVNQAIIRCRGVYSMWAKNNNVSYNRMLVLYTIREFGFCTQKQICDSYLLPRQTVNHVISEMKKDGILVTAPEKSTGKEKALVLTPEGERYSEKLLYSLSRMEERAAKRLGEEGFGAIEVCGAFGEELAKKMYEATGCKVPVGYVTTPQDQFEKALAFWS